MIFGERPFSTWESKPGASLLILNLFPSSVEICAICGSSCLNLWLSPPCLQSLTFRPLSFRFIQARKPTMMNSRVAIALAKPKFVPESRKAMLNV